MAETKGHYKGSIIDALQPADIKVNYLSHLQNCGFQKDTRRIANWRKSGRDSVRSILPAAATFWRAWRHTAGVFADAAI
jgi:hypothetical protein